MEPAERTLTADELVEEGKRIAKLGLCVVVLLPSQEWLAVKEQVPFIRRGIIHALTK